MSRRSGPDRDKAELLKLAAAVADGGGVAAHAGGNERAVTGLRVIAALSERLGSLQPALLGQPPARPALFQWGHLDVIERLGEGASAEVFRAYDPLLDVEVALKLSRPDLGRRATAEWIAEARRLARLRHPNVVTVHGVDVHGGRAGLWLDLVEGETVAAYGERRGPLPARELCLLGLELCNGLGAIHDAGLLHRDLKPANLLRERTGRILIADFGAAGSAALTGSALSQRGTPLAMAPELIEGSPASVASDLYSLGVVLHWLASGRLPVVADDIESLRRQHRQRALTPERLELDGVPARLCSLIETLLAVSPEERPASTREVAQQLAQNLEPAAVTSSADAEPPRAAARDGVDFTRVVAREAELAWLQQEQRRTVLGDGHPVLLSGESGTGKTSLIVRFADWLRGRGGQVLHVALSGYPPGRRRLITLLERALSLGHSGRAEPVEGGSEELARRLLTAAGSAPLLLCLDDLVYADSDEQAQIHALIAALRGSHVLVIGVLRTQAGTDAATVTALFGTGPTARLALEPFTPVQTETALASLLGAPGYEHDLALGAAAALHRLSGGNPFFLTELLRHLIANGDLVANHSQRRWHLRDLPAALPASLELAALERCRALPARTRSLLDAAAVLGERFRTDTLARLLGDNGSELQDDLQPAVAAGVLEPMEQGLLRFRHGLIQRVLYDAIAPERRKSLHAACAALLRDDGRAEMTAMLSLHAERAGDPATAFATGLAALNRGQDPEQSSLAACERLLALVAADGVDASAAQVLDLELRRVHALHNAGQLREASSRAEVLDRNTRRTPGAITDLRLRLALAHITFALGRHPAVVAGLQPVLADTRAASGRRRDLIDEARVLTVRAQAALGEYRVAEQAIATALRTPPRDPVLRLDLQTLYGWCIALQGRLREADERLDPVLRMSRDVSPQQRANILRRVHWIKLCRGRYQQAYALALAAHGDYRSVGDTTQQAKMTMALGQTRLLQGLPEEALGFLNRTVLRLEDIGDRHCEAETLWMLGRAYTELGRLDDAETQIDRALDLIAEVGDRDDEFRFLIERARLRLAQGRAQQALEAATQARAIAHELDSRDGAAFAEVEMAAALLASGDSIAALALCEPAAQTLRRLEAGEHWRADWLLGRCRLACDPGNAQAGATAFASAAATIERTLAELDPGDLPRRERIRQMRQPQLAAVAPAV